MNSDYSMKLDIYINYPGHCEEAFRFYDQHLGGKINMMMPHQPSPPDFPKEWKNPILHAIIEIGGTGITEGKKYMFSKNMKKSDPMITGWKNSVLIKKLADIKKLKKSKGPDIQVWGSSELVRFSSRMTL